MLIRDQLKQTFRSIAWALALAGSLFVLMYLGWLQMAAARSWAHEVLKAVFQCHVLGTEQVTQQNPRSEEQYKVSSANLGRLLATPPVALRSQSAVQEIRSRKQRIDQLLQRPDLEMNTVTSTERGTILRGQIVLDSTAMVSAAEALYLRADRNAQRLRVWTLVVNVLALIGVAASAGLAFYRVNRRLVGPLREMALGAQRLGTGELGYRLKLQRPDELGSLAQSLDAMAERLSQRQAELEEKLRDLDTFCYSLAHDLKAPLRTVSGFGELLELDHAAELSPEARQYIRAMRGASLKMAALIDDLLQYGALTHQAFVIEKVPLAGLIDDCLSDLSGDFAQRGASVSVGAMPAVLGNRSVLRQVIVNLLTNAVKFVPPDRKPNISISCQPDGPWCKLQIRDNGIGIAPEHHRSIFGLFQRLHRDSDYPGTGVGLAMVEKGVHLLGGTVGVESEPGQGSTFWLRLRGAGSEEPAPPPAPLADAKAVLK